MSQSSAWDARQLAGLELEGKTVLVVGGTSGIGNGIAQAFRGGGAQVHVWGTRASAADYRLDEGCDLEGLAFSSVNVADAASIAAFQPAFETLDVLVLSQGIVKYRRAEFEDDGFREVVEVNLNSLMSCSRRFRPMLKASQGSIIIVSSLSGLKGQVGNPAYGASKAGAISLTKSLAVAWATDGIRVNGLAPGLVDTKLTKVTTGHPERLASTLQRIPAARLGTPQDLAGPALFLASPLARYVTGQTLNVDGGLSA